MEMSLWCVGEREEDAALLGDCQAGDLGGFLAGANPGGWWGGSIPVREKQGGTLRRSHRSLAGGGRLPATLGFPLP